MKNTYIQQSELNASIDAFIKWQNFFNPNWVRGELTIQEKSNLSELGFHEGAMVVNSIGELSLEAGDLVYRNIRSEASDLKNFILTKASNRVNYWMQIEWEEGEPLLAYSFNDTYLLEYSEEHGLQFDYTPRRYIYKTSFATLQGNELEKKHFQINLTNITDITGTYAKVNTPRQIYFMQGNTEVFIDHKIKSEVIKPDGITFTIELANPCKLEGVDLLII